MAPTIGEARRAHKDLRAVLEAVAQEYTLAVARHAAEMVRTATREGRLDGATYGATTWGGTQVACVLGWVEVATGGYFGSSPRLRVYSLQDVGVHVEDYVGAIERGDTPATCRESANIARWCSEYLATTAPLAVIA